ncbi:unnamed protein product [Penicillium egyptiacum]|uniref:Uncharacterized protein n=1 Tax=Penicillium egyptiacum TaxID=1303716 RepID=A0A9W4KJ85_9EURO|nr:unnamed protein product [Penicillium egyptiacum]
MRLRSNHVLPPISEYVPRRRRTTRSASAQAGTEVATETVPEAAQKTGPESQSASDVAEQSAAERSAPKRKPAKRAGRKKAAAKGKKASAPTAETEAEPDEDPVTLIPSVEQPDTRTLPPKPRPTRDPPRMFRGRVMTAFRWGSASELLRKEQHPEPTPSSPQTPLTHYAWPPGRAYDKRRRIPWSLPWSPPSPWRNWPRRLAIFNTQDESVLTAAEEPTRKRNRSSEDDPSPSKRHKLTLQAPPGFENRPRGSSRRTYADRARRREAERGGRIDRTIYRFPQLLAQQGEDARSGNSTPLASRASEEAAPRGNRIVPFASLPSALPPNQNQNQNQNRPGWRQWIFNSVTGLWGRGNVPRTAQVPQVAEPQRPTGTESSSSVATPTSAPPSSSAVLPRNFESPTPRPRVAEPQTSNSRLTASARAPQAGKRKKYSYDLDPQGFDPELLARMRARKSNPAALQQPVTSPEQLDALSENESKKRKREPSPDVIPHPPGCSYGFDPEYFIYDNDDEDLPTGEQGRQDTTPKRAAVSAAADEEHVSKRARQDTTANQATVSDAPEEEIVSKRVCQDTTPKQATVSDAAEEEHVSKRVRQDTTANQATVSDAPEEEHVSKRAVSGNTHLENFKHQGASQPIEDSGEELRKARQLAEQYKPKTPSRLRADLRFESSWSSFVEDEAEEEAVRRRKMRKTSMATACPTGDLDHIRWPETETWVERFDWQDPNFAKYRSTSVAREGYLNWNHEVFMSKLAARRSAR